MNHTTETVDLATPTPEAIGFFIRRRGQVDGPYSRREIGELSDSGEIMPSGEVFSDRNWVSVREFLAEP